MFGIIADTLTTGLTVLLPVFLSYKTLQQHPPSALSPWLIYFLILTLLLQAESTFAFILDFVPFYSWLRLFAYAYLILPGTQGATYLYAEHLEPFLRQYERDIDEFIANAHDKSRKAGLDYLKKTVEYVRVNVLGMPPRTPTPPPSRQTSATYTQQLLSRFALPARDGVFAAPAMGAAGDLYGLLTSAVSAISGSPASREAQAEELSRSGMLVPDGLRGDERINYVSTQRERLRVLLQAFDREAVSMAAGEPAAGQWGGGGDYMRKSRSEAEFDRIEIDEAGSEGPSGGWMPWNWSPNRQAEEQARASGVDFSG
ncbi:hypothetical protein P152DRAFT_455892 [Eremomyces bilateralis CBS 781.70]|uniref:Protein YOP1 n=1 Tax=Eremomyces bilateralis CBS 781.70 TaxID=1392243 RepID=A0A6G1GA03_9PEZI|nr:uncharacterized protein P152DRAFT_455892 [Eremomyces bilateralis CBS 781.70]KAF1814854.1 hypothetical protein P152DRAFT_455892 [Eremomyces bilateralis CBS 781.70]